MKSPIPPRRTIDDRVAQLERVTSALIELANPEQFRKALAASTARGALADLAHAVARGQLTQATRVGPLSMAARFREVRAQDGADTPEVVTPAVVVQLASLDAATRAMFDGKCLGDQVVETNGVRAILDQVWDTLPPTRVHRPRGRHGRR